MSTPDEVAGSGEAHAAAGGSCMADDDFEGARDHWELAFRQLRKAGDVRGAARVAADLAGLHVSAWGNRAVGRGWIDRGRRVLGTRPAIASRRDISPSPCWVATSSTWTPCEEAAERALSLAVEFSDPLLEIRALSESGFALVAQGHLAEGFARLDEAMTAVTAGDVANLGVAAKCFCAMLSACDRCGELRRAQEWTAVVSSFVARHGDRPAHLAHSLSGRLRVADVEPRALARGRGGDAWGTFAWCLPSPEPPGGDCCASCGPSASPRPIRRSGGTARTLRRLRGLLCPAGAPAPGQGRGPSLAVAVIERGLDELVGDRVRAGPLLALLVEAELACDRVDAAAEAARRLSALVAQVDSPLLRTEAALAAGKVATATGDTRAGDRAPQRRATRTG